MELNQIRYFLEVAESQHITKSAEKLHIAQPSLTQAIHRFEENVGVPLFVSKGRNIMLNEYGKYLQKKLIPIIDELDKIPEELKTMAKLSNETIHLNVLAASTLITEAIIEFKKERGNINFQLLQNNQSELYDIEITTKMFYQANREERTNEYVCKEKIFLAVPNNNKYKEITAVNNTNLPIKVSMPVTATIITSIANNIKVAIFPPARYNLYLKLPSLYSGGAIRHCPPVPGIANLFILKPSSYLQKLKLSILKLRYPYPDIRPHTR